MLAAADILQTVFSGTLAIAARLLAVSGVVENIQQFFSIFPCFIEQRDILGIPNIGRYAGGIHDHCTAVPTAA